MKAVRIHSFGSADVLHLEEVSKPKPGHDGILIQVHAAGVNPVDYKIRSGGYTRSGLRLPLTLGRDVSGVVEDVGPAVTKFKRGDTVYAMLGKPAGGYAEYAVATEEQTAAKPITIDHIHAAAVPLAATTAWQGLFDHGNLQAGQRVLIHGAAGGVGHFALQFAKARGAEVIATAAGRDLVLVREFGADQVIDYQHDRFEDETDDIDLVLDLIAGDTQERSWKVLKDGGTLVTTLGAPSPEKAAVRHAEAKTFLAEPKAGQLEEIARLIDEGKVSIYIDRTLPLSEARQAHEHLENDHIRGKVVLEVI